MNPPTRLAFWAASWVLWVAATVLNALRTTERLLPAQESWWTLYACLALAGAYVAWRIGLVLTDSEWVYGWRR